MKAPPRACQLRVQIGMSPRQRFFGWSATAVMELAVAFMLITSV